MPARSTAPDMVKVWDLPLRLTHWALAFFVLGYALVEVNGPEGTINIRPNEQGELTVAPADAKTTADPKDMIQRCIQDVKEYRARKALFK